MAGPRRLDPRERCESGRIGFTANELTWVTGSEGSNPSLSARGPGSRCARTTRSAPAGLPCAATVVVPAGCKESEWSRGRYWLQTLGCPKNQVDSDKLEGRLAGQGYRRAADPSEADLVVVNTCAFIESARQESIDTVLELADLRRPAPAWSSPAAWPSATASEMTEALPEVDLVAGFGVDFADARRRRQSAGHPDRRTLASSRPPPRQGVRSARAGPPGVGGPLGLREGGRGVRPHLRLLCHPLLPGQAAVAPASTRSWPRWSCSWPAGRRRAVTPRRRCARSCWWPRTWRPTAGTAHGRVSG